MKKTRLSKDARSISYASVGVDREKREKFRKSSGALLNSISKGYQYGEPISLPFGLIFPAGSETYYDLQIEGVGTKTLVAELTGKFFDTIGIDAVAMAVNDTIRSGARPLLIADAIHVGYDDSPEQVKKIIEGVSAGAKESNCVISSGETGNVTEILHERLNNSSPFDIFVSSLGIVGADDVIRGNTAEGDVLVGIESSGIHSNGLTLARKLLLKAWGGYYELSDTPDGLDRTIAEELMEPTRIYVNPLLATARKLKIKAALHITGDGFGKFNRLLNYEGNKSGNVGFQFDSLGIPPYIFTLIQEVARKLKSPLSMEELFRTFNMGYGFAVVVAKEDEDAAIDSFNRYFPARRIGRVTGDGKVIVNQSGRKMML